MRTTKKILAAILAGCLATPALATEVQDTLVIEDANKVKIETRDTVQRIVINGMKSDPEFHYVQRISIPDSSAVRRTMKSVRDFNKITIKKKDGTQSKWDNSYHVNIGLNAMLDTPDGYGVKVWPSFNIGVGCYWDWHPNGKQNEWSIGLGLDWRHYRMSEDKLYWGKDAANMSLLNRAYYPQAKDATTSMQVASLQVPLVYTHYFDKQQEWSLSVGALVNWNFAAHGEGDFELGEEDHHIELNKFGQRPFTVEGFVKVDAPHIPALYCRYCPMKFFRDNRGPKMHQLTFGIFL